MNNSSESVELPRRPQLVVPVLTLLDQSGRVDFSANRAYAERAANSGIDAFIVAGTIGDGDFLSRQDHSRLIETWLSCADASRIFGCSWDRETAASVSAVGARPMMVLRDHSTEGSMLALFARLPTGSYVYSHPKYSQLTYTGKLSELARKAGVMPHGGKICKVDLDEIRDLRQKSGPSFQIFDGRCRYVAASVEAGADGVIAVPLCTLPGDVDSTDVSALQALINLGQKNLDLDANHAERVQRLARECRSNLRGDTS